MGQFIALNTDGQLNKTVGNILEKMLQQGLVKGVLVPSRQPFLSTLVPSLITDPSLLEHIDPFAPVVTTSAAKIVAALTATPTAEPLAVVLRSCEVRAFSELVKLHQGSVDDLILVGVDCLGRYKNTDYRALADHDPDFTATFLARYNSYPPKADPPAVSPSAPELVKACQACEDPLAENVDLRLGLLGLDHRQQLGLEWLSEKGKQIFEALGFIGEEPPPSRRLAVQELTEARRAFKKKHFAEFLRQSATLSAVTKLTAGCVNCYNCRVACPVCYCRECVFVTDTFRHDSEQYLKWSHKLGQLKMPTDTLFYHLTRMVHMSTLCVGCGQCSSACPNDVPVMELIQSVAEKTQARFDYRPGRSLEEPQPLTIFHADEFSEVTGQTK
jgi:formate dehydrogenase subunit beta